MAVLESPSGQKYHTESPREITRLKAHGYKVVQEEPPAPPTPPRKQAASSSGESNGS